MEQENPCDLFKNINEYFSSSYKVANFENPATGQERVNLGYRAFNAPSFFLPCIKETFDLIQLANNHILDQGEEGLALTLKEMDKYGIDYIGVGENME